MTQSQNTGGFLFKYRGQIPVVYLMLIVPISIYLNVPIFLGRFGSSIWLISTILVVFGVLVRVFTIGQKSPHTSGRNRNIHVAKSLNVTGFYSITQHPLYCGSFLIWIGISLIANNLTFLISVIIFSVIFLSLIVREERIFLTQNFGSLYLSWAKKTPAFYINPFLYSASNEPFNLRRVLASEYPTWVSVIAGYLLMELINAYKNDSLNYWKCFLLVGLGLVIGISGRTFKYIIMPKFFKNSF